MTDEYYMGLCLDEAKRAAESGEVPVGAVVVREGVVLGRGANRSIGGDDPTAHAEIVALRAASSRVGNYRLVEAELFVTVEPCLMCVGALLQARVKRVIFGCHDPKGGFLGSLGDYASDARLNHAFEVRSGVLGESASELVRRFFRERRR